MGRSTNQNRRNRMRKQKIKKGMHRQGKQEKKAGKAK
jgi:hypothetical protein